MQRSRFTDSQIMDALKRAEAGLAVPEVCRGAGHQLSDVLQMAFEVRRHGRIADGAHEGARGRERTAAQDGRRGEAQGRDRDGGARKKVVRPSRRREMAQRAVQDRGVSIRMASKRSESARLVIATSPRRTPRTRKSPPGCYV